jgi:hypothetical protein
MSQPEWKFVDNFGDVNPVDHGGRFVFKDETGVYAPEVAVLICPEDVEDVEIDGTDGETEEYGKWELYRYVMENCTYQNGVLSDNQFHPDYPVWFADDLQKLADFVGRPKEELIEQFCSDDPRKRVWAWEAVDQYWGFENCGAGQPCIFECRSDIEKWCKEQGIEV